MAENLENNKLLNSDDSEDHEEESNVSVCLEKRLIQAAPLEYLEKCFIGLKQKKHANFVMEWRA